MEENVQRLLVNMDTSQFHWTQISSLGKRKRDVTELESGVRRKRAGGPDLVTAREFECIQTGSKGYWKYDYTIPDKCYSELLDMMGRLV